MCLERREFIKLSATVIGGVVLTGCDDTPHKDSLLHIPNGELSASRVLLSSGDTLAGSNHYVKSFGLFDPNDQGDSSTTVFARNPALQATQTSVSPPESGFNLVSHVDSSLDHQLSTSYRPLSTVYRNFGVLWCAEQSSVILAS